MYSVMWTALTTDVSDFICGQVSLAEFCDGLVPRLAGVRPRIEHLLQAPVNHAHEAVRVSVVMNGPAGRGVVLECQ